MGLRSRGIGSFFAGFLALALLCWAVWLVRFAVNEEVFQGDSVNLSRGSIQLLECLKSPVIGNCSQAGPYALAQYIPAVAMAIFGRTEMQILTGLVTVSLASFFLSLGLVYASLVRQKMRAQAAFLTAAVLGSSFLWYAHTTYGEALAAFLIVLFCVLVVQKSHWVLIFLAALFAATTKGVAAPFIVLIGLAILVYQAESATAFRRHSLWRLGAVALGAFSGYALNVCFDFYRYGVFQNALYAKYLQSGPTWEDRIVFFFGQLISPNAGMVFFSFGLGLILAASWWFLIRQIRIAKRVSWKMLPGLLLALTYMGLSFGFSSWFAPYGWVSWGGRLLFPWIPGLAFTTLSVAGLDFNHWLRGLAQSKRRFAVVLIALLVLAVPQSLALFNARPHHAFFSGNAECPTAAQIEVDQTHYYRCLVKMSFPTKTFVLVNTVTKRPSREGKAFTCLSLLIISLLMLKFRREASSIGGSYRELSPNPPQLHG